MRRALLALVGAALIGAALTLGACPAAHDPFPDLTCKTDSDCFLGETCVMLVCTANKDLATPDVALPIVDFSTPGADQ